MCKQIKLTTKVTFFLSSYMGDEVTWLLLTNNQSSTLKPPMKKKPLGTPIFQPSHRRLLHPPPVSFPFCSPDDRHIPEAVLGRVPSDRELSRLASLLGPEWDSLLLHLGLSAGALYRCRADHPLDAHGRALAGLVKWRQSVGRAATVGRLLEGLRAAEVHPSVLSQVLQ